MSKNVPEVFEINAEGNAHLQIFLVCSSLFGAIEEIKSLLVAYGVPYGFLDLDCDSHSTEKNANTLWKSKTIIWKVPMGVFEMKTFESDTRSIIGLEPAKQAVEKYRSDLLAVCERNEDLEQSFSAEIAIVAKHLKTVKETEGNKRIMQTSERVERV